MERKEKAENNVMLIINGNVGGYTVTKRHASFVIGEEGRKWEDGGWHVWQRELRRWQV